MMGRTALKLSAGAASAAALAFFLFFMPPASEAVQRAAFVPEDPMLPLSQVKAGMRAEVRTVLQGTKIFRFSATLLGVVPRLSAPKNLILIRIDDPTVRANGGIAAGMSGSPVYVGGKLVGAIGYGWPFSDNNLGLVTPIEEMVKAFDWAEKIPPFGISPLIPSEPLKPDEKTKPEDEEAEEEAEEPRKEPVSADAEEEEDPCSFSIEGISSADAASDDKCSEEQGDAAEPDREKDDETESDAGGLAPEIASADIAALYDAKLTPLLPPLLVDGISGRMTDEIKKRLGIPMLPLGGTSSSSPAAKLDVRPEPGAAIGASLAWGDIRIGGIGTLTALSKDGRFLGFGHPMVGRGAVSFPLTEAAILQVIPGMEISFKLGYQGAIIGLITQDRPEAIAGHLGLLAPAISYKVTYNDVDSKKQFVRRFQTAADPFAGPVIGSMGMLGIIDDLWARRGEGTAILRYRFYGGNLPQGWERRNIFFSDTDLVGMLLAEFDAFSELFALNQFQEIRPFGVELDVEITRDARVVFIEKLDIADKKEFYSPGEKIELEVTLRPWRRRSMVKKIPLIVPRNAMGFCEILIRGGGIMEPEQESLATGLRAISNLGDLLRELGIKETNNQIVAEIDGPQAREKGDREKPSVEDLLDDRLGSEIRAEKIKKGAMVVVDTNFYVEGLLRKMIKIKRPGDKGGDEPPTPDEEAEMRRQAEALEASGGELLQ